MFSKLEGHFSFCASKRKVPGEGLKNSDGIPPSHKAMEVRVGEVGKNRCHLSQVRLSTFIRNRTFYILITQSELPVNP